MEVGWYKWSIYPVIYCPTVKTKHNSSKELVHVCICIYIYMDVSENSGTPKSSILIGFSIINHPFRGTPIFGNTHMYICTYVYMYVYMYICIYGWRFHSIQIDRRRLGKVGPDPF